MWPVWPIRRPGSGWSFVWVWAFQRHRGAWLLQATELSCRLGGKSRRTERQVYQGWKRNQDDVNGETPE